MAAPVYNSQPDPLTSQSLGAAANVTSNLIDISIKIEGQIHIINTPGGSVSATRGLQVDFYRMYGTIPTQAESPSLPSYTLPSQTASTAESSDSFLSTGKWKIKLTNLDAANAVTVQIKLDTIDSIS